MADDDETDESDENPIEREEKLCWCSNEECWDYRVARVLELPVHDASLVCGMCGQDVTEIHDVEEYEGEICEDDGDSED